jgi:exosortase/archaeosortase family protein
MTTHSRLLRVPTFVRLGIAIDTAPAGLWLALLVAAIWPTLWWTFRRMVDGSDEPLGALALVALGWLAWRHRRSWRVSPRLGWLALALACAVGSTVLIGLVPPLASSLVGLLAIGAGLAAFLPGVATAPVLGLATLSLPLLASLQFYAGFPLRVITAEAASWLLSAFYTVQREGTTLVVDGQTVIVDAPCSGVQMLWLGYFTACVVALHAARRNASFLARLPAVSAIVLAGNVLRNAVLVGLEATGRQPQWLHDATGLFVLAGVCVAIAKVMYGNERDRHV